MYIVRRINIHAIYHISVANLREHDEEVAQLLGQKRKKKTKKKKLGKEPNLHMQITTIMTATMMSTMMMSHIEDIHRTLEIAAGNS